MNPRGPQVLLPAEMMCNGVLGEDFRSAYLMQRGGWTLVGTPTFGPQGGMELDGANRATYLLNGEFDSDELTFHIPFAPTFAANDGVIRRMFDCTATDPGRCFIYFVGDGQISVRLGDTTVLTAAAVDVLAAWRVNQFNLLSVSGKGGANIMWLNGVQIASSTTAWTGGPGTMLYWGSSTIPSQYFAATFLRLYIAQRTSTLAEHTAYWNNSMWDYINHSTTRLQFRIGDFDPTNVRTLDSSGNGNHFTLGDGVTPATFPTQGEGRMEFDGGDYLAEAAVAQATGAFTVAATIKAGRNTATEWVAGHGPAAACNWLLANVSGQWSFYVGGLAGGNRAYMPVAIDRLSTHTYVGIWTGSATLLYVDGIYQGAAVTPVAPSFGAQNMTLGKSTNAASGYFLGDFYDFAYDDGHAWNQLQVLDYRQRMMAVVGSER